VAVVVVVFGKVIPGVVLRVVFAAVDDVVVAVDAVDVEVLGVVLGLVVNCHHHGGVVGLLVVLLVVVCVVTLVGVLLLVVAVVVVTRSVVVVRDGVLARTANNITTEYNTM